MTNPCRRKEIVPPPIAALHPRDRSREGPPRRGWLEHARPGQGGAGLHADSEWRNRVEFVHGREEIVALLTRKWAKELDYRLIKELWAFTGNRIAVRFAYEWHDDSGNWFRSYGNENWEFDDDGLMRHRHASINDRPDRRGRPQVPLAARAAVPDDHPGLSDLGL